MKNAATLAEFIDLRIGDRSDCWEWIGPLNRDGYGVVNHGARKRLLAHRAAYIALVGPIPDGITADHMCHNNDLDCPGGTDCRHRRCVNPTHLDLVAPGENSRRGKTPGALNLAKETCPEGHPYSHVDRKGWRKCRTCEKSRMKSSDDREKVSVSSDGPRRWTVACSRGHEWTARTTRWSKGKRYCKICDLINLRARRARRKLSNANVQA